MEKSLRDIKGYKKGQTIYCYGYPTVDDMIYLGAIEAKYGIKHVIIGDNPLVKLNGDKPENVIRSDNLHDHNLKTACVCVYKSGCDFDAHIIKYLNNLVQGMENHTYHVKYDWFCITDKPELKVKNMTMIPMISNLKHWHSKYEIFREDLWVNYANVFYCDLDTMITGRMDEILLSTKDIMMPVDYYDYSECTTSNILFNPIGKQFLFDKAVQLNPDKDIWDQKLTNKWLEEAGIYVDRLNNYFKIGSYKKDIIARGLDPSTFNIINFHGHPRPHEVNFELKRMNKPPRVMAKNNNHKKVLKWCKDETVYIIGGGPSLKGIDIDNYLIGKKVLGINDGYLFNCVKTCFFGDKLWYNHHQDNIDKLIFEKQWYTTSSGCHNEIKYINMIANGCSNDSNVLAWNGNSGTCGINLALLGGASKIYLLGFDMKYNDKNESNWHINIRRVLPNTYPCFISRFEKFYKEYKQKYPKVEIINACIDSALPYLPKMELMDVLNNAKENTQIF